jgi:DNA-binding transcriptional ArsR family regulator
MIRYVRLQHNAVYDFLLAMARASGPSMHPSDLFRKGYESAISVCQPDIKVIITLSELFNGLSGQIQSKMVRLYNSETRFFSFLIFYVKKENLVSIEDLILTVSNCDPVSLLRDYFDFFRIHFRAFPSSIDLDFSDTKALHSFVEKLPFSVGNKWEILQFCINPIYLRDGLVDTMSNFYSLYKEVMPKVEKQVKKIESDLKQKLKIYGNSYLSVLFSAYYKDDPIEKKINISVSLFLEAAFLIYYINQEEDLFIVGSKHIETFVERKHDPTKDVQIFKALGDETRQSIISLLSERDRYGEELSRDLDLSNSTISYHIGILLMEGFVNLNRIENRTYYSLDREKIIKTLKKAADRMTGTIDTTKEESEETGNVL